MKLPAPLCSSFARVALLIGASMFAPAAPARAMTALLVFQVTSALAPHTQADLDYVLREDTHLGYAVAPYGDWDKDGRDDFLVSAPRPWSEDFDGMERSRVLLVSGRDASLLMVVRVEGWWSAARAEALDDLDGDGAREILIVGQGPTALVIAGRTGAVLRNLGGQGESGRGLAAARPLRDIDGDCVGDIGVLERDRLHLLSGRSGAELGKPLQLDSADFLGTPDLDGDGVGDLIYVECARRGTTDGPQRMEVTLRVVSLRERKLLRESVLELEPEEALPRAELAVDPSGAFAVIGIPRSISSQLQGRAWLVPLRTAGEARALTFEKQGPTFGYSVAIGGDVDRDGTADVLVSSVTTCFDERVWGGACLFSGASGKLLRSHTGDAMYGDPFSALAWVGDVDGDGTADYACAAVPLEGTALIGSFVEVHSGATGALLIELPGAWEARAKSKQR